LERLTAEEVVAAGHRVVDESKRQVVVESDAIVGSPPRLADDLFVVHGAVTDPGRTKDALVAAVRALEVPPAESGAFAVSASFVGVRNYNRFDIEDFVGAQLGGRYYSRRQGVAPPAERSEWRVVLDGKTMWLGLRPYAVPLHRRPWRTRTVRGSLHPPVAAAMARLAGIAPGQHVLDPFCGAGTLLLEAHAVEPQASYVGSDRDSAALAAARENAAGAAGIRRARDAAITWRRGDAARLSATADRIITNPPWDVRLSIGDLTPYIRQWRRALDGRLVAILTPHQAAQLDRGWRVLARYDLAVAGQHPRIVVAEPARS
jgi:23S rRNA G2445 N2-methylase RlmL